MKNLVLVVFSFLIVISGCDRKESSDEVKINRNNTSEYVASENLQRNGSSEKTSSGESPILETITSKEVKLHIGDSLSIEGYVADIYLSDKVAYLNFENKFPKNTFTVTIFSGKLDEFGDLSKFKGRKVRVTGRITSYKSKPQVVLNSKDQIRIIN